MIPVVTPSEMAEVDAAAPDPVEVLIERAGAAVARLAVSMMGGCYGRRVVVVAGPGNNGADGRACARRLERSGVDTLVFDAAAAPASLPPADLYVDAAFGTGLRRGYEPPHRGSPEAPVLAVDIPSGVDGLTGAVVADGRPWAAERTVTFAALKPGLLLEPGRSLAGRVEVVDIGLDVGPRRVGSVETADVAAWIPRRAREAHKWTSAGRVVAGGRGMTGAATLATGAAMVTGAGHVQLLRPGVDPDGPGPTEAVRVEIPPTGWSEKALANAERIRAGLIGPGLGSGPEVVSDIVETIARWPAPLVVDADALIPETVEAIRSRAQPTILTPHDGELARIGGDPTDGDRVGATIALAGSIGAHVLRKGPATIVASPDGRARIVADGDQRLATAGSGDVLAGMILGLLTRGADPFDAAAGAAHLHALAASLASPEGLVAGDLISLVPVALDRIREG